jgi:flagellar motor switch protein FliN/FliY
MTEEQDKTTEAAESAEDTQAAETTAAEEAATDESTPQQDAQGEEASQTATATAKGEDAADQEAADAEQAADGDEVQVQEAKLPDVEGMPAAPTGGQIDILLDTTMPIEVRLGEVDLEVRELLRLSSGSIITLEKLAGEPLDLYLKGIRFATGQLVVAGDNLGVRIIEILSPGKKD